MDVMDGDGGPTKPLTNHYRYKPKKGDELSWREREVIAQAMRGFTNKQIGEVLFIERKTVTFHMGRIFKKLGIKNRAQLILLECKRLEKSDATA